MARGINLARGDAGPNVRWSSDFLERLTVTALLRYLAVAHFGRGRGDWSEGEHPAFWQALVEQEVARRRANFTELLRRGVGQQGVEAGQSELAVLISEIGMSVLKLLYPQAILSSSAQTEYCPS